MNASTDNKVSEMYIDLQYISEAVNKIDYGKILYKESDTSFGNMTIYSNGDGTSFVAFLNSEVWPSFDSIILNISGKSQSETNFFYERKLSDKIRRYTKKVSN